MSVMKLVIVGAAGRMGQALIRAIARSEGIERVFVNGVQAISGPTQPVQARAGRMLRRAAI